ncbi:MAG: transcription termination/antitermination protein NusG [Pirellulales bacterium]|nr:transcription termination/antitermination protein NusG [Pirellulales bacterium]
MIDDRDSTAEQMPPLGEPDAASFEAQSANTGAYAAAPSDAPTPLEGDDASPPQTQPPKAAVDAAGEGMVAAEVAPQAAAEAGEPVTGGMPTPEPEAIAESPAEAERLASEVAAAQRTQEEAEAEVAAPAEPAASPAKRNGRSAAAKQPVAADESVSDEPIDMKWYILKVQSNREETIADGLRRRAAIAGLDKHFGEVIVPTEMVTEFKGGKKKVVKRKLYPGYIVVNMHINEDTWFLVRDTPGIGDFTGAGGKPIPMQEHEVSRLIAKQEEKTEEAPKLKISFKPGDRVKINEGTFENFEGDVDSIDQTNGRVTVMINIFGRSTPVELEYWQVESV